MSIAHPAPRISSKLANEAYEVLKDPEKRKRYDTLGNNWQGGSGFHTPAGIREFRVPFREWQRRRRRISAIFSKPCLGVPVHSATNPRLAAVGDTAILTALGEVEGPVRILEGRVRDVDAITKRRSKSPFKMPRRGATRTIELGMPGSGPGGFSTGSKKSYQVKIPRGVTDGSRIRLAGQGDKGSSGGPDGDLFLKVRLRPDPRFEVSGHNLRTKVDIAPWAAVLGTDVQVPTLESPVTMKIPAGTQSGQTLRLRGKGMPSAKGAAGDILVTVRVLIPTNLTDRERELYEQLASEARR